MKRPGVEGQPTKFYTGRLRPEVQTFALLYTIFDGKGTPFIYLPATERYHFHIPPERLFTKLFALMNQPLAVAVGGILKIPFNI